jgi:hypothetical protein
MLPLSRFGLLRRAMMFFRHARARPGHPSFFCKTWLLRMDCRVKPGNDEATPLPV